MVILDCSGDVGFGLYVCVVRLKLRAAADVTVYACVVNGPIRSEKLLPYAQSPRITVILGFHQFVFPSGAAMIFAIDMASEKVAECCQSH